MDRVLEFITNLRKRSEYDENVFLAYLCGYFHTYPKQARQILREMAQRGLVKHSNGIVSWKKK